MNWRYILIVIILAVIVGGGILGYLYWRVPKQEMPSLDFPFKKIESVHEDCSDELIYKTNLAVKDEVDAQKAFQQYIDYMKANKLKDRNLAVDWEIEKAEYAGYYKDLPYWLITYNYVMEGVPEEGRARGYVNKNGEIVNFICLPPGGDALIPPDL